MTLHFRFFLLALVFVFQINAQTPGVSTFYEQFPGDTRAYIEYIPGNLPIIISAPHGGVKQSGQTIGGTNYPDNDSTLPDRSCGTNERDDNTDILIREIQAEIFALTGCYAHVIINNLHRSKLDPNREQNEATCGDSDALDHWNAWHNFIDQASTSVEANWGKGLYIDLHGQSHTIPRIEIGYNITAGELNSGNLNSTANIDRSTIKSLVMSNLNNLSHEDLIRGDNSLGQLFQEQPAVFYNANVNPGCGVTTGYRAVPSNSDYGNTSCDDTRPYSNAYFDGNFYNNRRHGSGNGSGTNAGMDDGGGTIDGIMTEVNRRVRDLGTYNGNVYDTRPQTLVPFAKEYANVVLDYIDIHYNDFAAFTYASNIFDVNDPDPSPTIMGLPGGTFSSTSGLIIDSNTGIIDLSNSAMGVYDITYTIGDCGYYSETFNIEITEIIPDTEAPSTPTNLVASNVAQTTLDLSWTASTDNIGVTGYDIYQDGVFITTVVSTSYQIVGLTPNTAYNFYVIAKDAAGNSSAQSNQLSVITLDVPNCSGTIIASYPYLETFDSEQEDWSQDMNGDDGDWTSLNGSTPSNNTGPSDDITGGGKYLYTEASTNGLGANATVILTSLCFDLSSINDPYFSFYYHMFGADIGTLDLEISLDDGNNWSNIFTASGNIGNVWNVQNIDLSNYLGQTAKFRFIGTTGSTWRSDIAIDHISIGAPLYCFSNGNDTSDEFIGRVQLNTLDNDNSGQGITRTGYSDFTENTSLTTDVLSGSQYTITITPEWTGNPFNEGYAVWIDYNNDGDFLDNEELVWSLAASQNTPVSGSFTIPVNVNFGETRMRVSMKFDGIPTTCESFNYGEVEDYTINIVYDGLLFKNNTWIPNAPSDSTANTNALVMDGTYTVSSNIELNDLIINDDAIVEVIEGQSVVLNGELNVTGDLILNSTSNQYSSLILDGTATGNIVYKRHVNTNASTTGNDLISAPLTGQAFGDFAAANTNMFFNPSTPTEKLFGPFDKVSGTYLTYDTNVAVEAAIVLNPAIGYRSASTNNGTFDFKGTVNTGAINTPIFISGATFPEWNLIGNPYPSYIDLSDFLAANNTQLSVQSGGIYGYDGDATNGWTIWNQATADLAEQNLMPLLITPGQGFLVASATATASIDFTPSMRRTGNSDDFILGRQDNNSNIVHLQLELNNTTEGFFKTDFYFTDNASNGMDFNYDSSVFGNQAPSDFALYSQLLEANEGIDLGIQSLGFDALSNATIPLGIHVQEGQQFTISISESTLPSNIEIYLEDTVANTFTLLNTTDYTISSTEDINSIGRYFLRFNEDTLGIDSTSDKTIEIYTTTQSKGLFVEGQLPQDSDLSIFDLQGRLIESHTLSNSEIIHRINISSISTGIYLVTLKNDLFEKTQKVIFK
ncbi:GEVED domain-containing protein [Psychroserpens sp. MEBiC05023]